MNRSSFLRALAGAALAAAFAWPAAAQNTQPVRILLGFPPGASGDTLTRKLADKMHSLLGEPVIVDNRPGAGGRIALEQLKAAPRDGRTLIFTPNTPLTAAPWLYDLRYDPFKDFQPIAHVASFGYVFVVNPAVKATNLKEFAAAVKADHKLAFYAAASPGGGAHMALDTFSRAQDLGMSYVGYRGTGNALTDLIGGQLPTFIGNTADFVEFIRQGKIKPLATLGDKRSPFLPDVPTFREQGFDIESSGWFAMYAPAGTPPAIVERLSRAVIAAAQDPDVRTLASSLGLEMTGLGPAELAAAQKAEYEISGPRIKASGFKPQE